MFLRESFGRTTVSYHKNCRNSRTSNDIDMKHGLVTKIYKKSTATLKNLASCWQNVTSLSFFQFMAHLEQSGSPIPDMWSVKLTFLLAVYLLSFTLAKVEAELKNIQHSIQTISLSKGTSFAKKCLHHQS